MTPLLAWARTSGWGEERVLRAVKGHEREVAEEMESAVQLTWEGYPLLYGLLKQAGLPVQNFCRFTWAEFLIIYHETQQQQAKSPGSPEPADPGPVRGGDQR
jgi:hypothetical protein